MTSEDIRRREDTNGVITSAELNDPQAGLLPTEWSLTPAMYARIVAIAHARLAEGTD